MCQIVLRKITNRIWRVNDFDFDAYAVKSTVLAIPLLLFNHKDSSASFTERSLKKLPKHDYTIVFVVYFSWQYSNIIK